MEKIRKMVRLNVIEDFNSGLSGCGSLSLWLFFVDFVIYKILLIERNDYMIGRFCKFF